AAAASVAAAAELADGAGDLAGDTRAVLHLVDRLLADLRRLVARAVLELRQQLLAHELRRLLRRVGHRDGAQARGRRQQELLREAAVAVLRHLLLRLFGDILGFI